MTSSADAFPPQKWPPITVAQAHAISKMTDPALRNLKITQGYHDLKTALTRLFGVKNVTWCAYATWASKTAGTFIRGEEVPKLVRSCVGAMEPIHAMLDRCNGALSLVHPAARLDSSFIMDIVEQTLRDVTKNVGQGNLIVFQELAPLYAAWLQVFETRPSAYDQNVIDAFIAKNLKPGPVSEGGQDLLIQAFRAYYDTMLQGDPGIKAQQMLLANLLVGYHEQTRLQGPIAGALDAPIDDLLLSEARSRACAPLPAILRTAVHAVIDELVRPIAARIKPRWHQVATRWLMTLSIPGVELDLGRDVPSLGGGRMFPDELRVAGYPPLIEVLAKLDRTADTVEGSAAVDWTDLSDRMNFVADFFRTYQQDQALYQQPFTDGQVAVIVSGGMPEGKL